MDYWVVCLIVYAAFCAGYVWGDSDPRPRWYQRLGVSLVAWLLVPYFRIRQIIRSARGHNRKVK